MKQEVKLLYYCTSTLRSIFLTHLNKDSGNVYCSEWPAQQGTLWKGGDGSQFGAGGGGGYYGGGGGGLKNIKYLYNIFFSHNTISFFNTYTIYDMLYTYYYNYNI